MPMRLGRLQRQSRRGCRAPPHRSSMPPICAPRILRRHSGPMPCRLSAARIINFSSVMSTSERSSSLAGRGIAGNLSSRALVGRANFRQEAATSRPAATLTAPALIPTDNFNGDGHGDILWQSSNGTPAIWLMDGTNAVTVGAAGSFNPGPSWQIKGTGDFNGDGKSDILWQGSDGTPAIWLMDGTHAVTVSAAGSFNPGHDWHVIV